MNPLSFRINILPSPNDHKTIVSYDGDHSIANWWRSDNESIEHLNGRSNDYDNQLFSRVSLRYRPESNTAKRLLTRVFKSAWDHSDVPLASIIHVVKKLDPKLASTHMTLSKMFFIDCPSIIGNTFKYFSIFPLIYISYYNFHFLKHIYSTIIPTRVIPFLINQCPVKILEIGSIIISGISLVSANRFRILLYSYLLASFVRKYFPDIPYLSDLAKTVTITNCLGVFILLSPEHSISTEYKAIIISLASTIQLAEGIRQIFSGVADYFIKIATTNETEMNYKLQQHLLTLWLSAMLDKRSEN